MSTVSEQQINQIAEGLLKPVRLKNNSFLAVHSPEKSTSESLAFISSLELLQQAIQKNALGFIILEKKFAELEQQIPATATVWTTPHIQQAMTRVLQLFDRQQEKWPVGIHPTAVIHPDAVVSKKAHVGPYAVIQQFAVVKDNTKIGAHTVVEAYAQIGADTLISPHVVIGSHCEVGNHCIISSHVTIGSDGFGFFTDRSGHHKIPQIGIVVIEDHCELGASCSIDRATLEQTIIRRGSKLDNHCHIAHNVDIGENAILAAAFKTAGSTKFGKNLMASGNIDINGHIEICDNVILTGRTGVISSITTPGIYGGFPCEPQKQNIRNIATIPHLSKIRKNVQKIMKHLKLEE